MSPTELLEMTKLIGKKIRHKTTNQVFIPNEIECNDGNVYTNDFTLVSSTGDTLAFYFAYKGENIFKKHFEILPDTIDNWRKEFGGV